MSILERLRNETRGEHESIERRLNLGREGWTREEVRRLLEGFYGFYEPWEREIGRALAGFGMAGLFEGRAKVGALEADLADLGVEDLSAVPRCRELPAVDSPGRALGSMYVVEGSTLGGQVIWRRLTRSVEGMGGGAGCSFFACYGAEVGSKWREFQGVLREREARRGALEGVVEAARETFGCMERWLAHGRG